MILIAPNHDIVEQDIWPISSANDIINAITPYGPAASSCVTTLTANFSGTPTTLMYGGTVDFTDLSGPTGTITSWSWSFPGANTTTSSAQNPTGIQYDTPGVYDVSLTVGDGTGTDIETKTGYITVTSTPTYCTAGASSIYEYINSFVFNTISNTGTGLGTGGYQDYTSISTDITQGNAYTATITLGSPYTQDRGRIWIDWNQDGDFIDAGEQVFESVVGNGPYTGSVNVPAGATPGNTRMRVRIWDTSAEAAGVNGGPCGIENWGEVEDYTVNIISSATPPDAAFTPSTTSICAGGSISFTDNSTGSPTSWAWDFGDGNTSTQQNPTHTFAANGTYTVMLTATNAYGSDYFTVIVTVNPLPTANAGADQAICLGNSATLTASGGTTYNWTGGYTGATVNVSPTSSMTYIVTVTDANGCTDTDDVLVTVNMVPYANVSTTPASCGTADGTATANATGGTGTYTYTWDANAGSQTSQTATGLAAGTYYVTVSDGNCTTVTSGTVNNAGGASVVMTGWPVSCYGGSDGSASALVTGGTPPYTYAWSVAGTDTTQLGLSAGTYYFTVTDDNGCITIDSVIITEPAQLAVSVTTGNGTATANPSGGSGSYTYLWSNTETTQTISGLPTGVYYVTVTDGNGCTAVDSASVINTGLTDNRINNVVYIYPNPTDGKITVDLNAQAGCRVEITDVTGRVVIADLMAGNRKVYDLSGYGSGMYFVRLKYTGYESVHKIIVQ
ncbi:MAG: PKD domain-containing protein [Bacteroidota bacterium]